MDMRTVAIALSLSLAVLAGGAHAQQAAQVTVGVGPLLQSKTADFGAREVDRLRKDLGDEVTRAIARNPQIVRVDLVLEDAQPNRPTFDQMGRTPGLSLRSVGVGGARISGNVTTADGVTRPIRFQWYETDISQERAANTWTDADRAFDWLASDIAAGKAPNAYRGPGPEPTGGHFGYPFRGN